MAQREVAYGDLVTSIPGLWTNPRSFTGLDPKAVAELADDIKARSIKNPLTVQRVRLTGKNGVIELVTDGQRRILAANKAGFKKDDKILVVDQSDEIIELTEKSSAKLLIDVLAIGTFREGLSSFEQSAAAESLRNAGKSLSEIGKAIRRSEAWVSLMLKARKNATPELLENWRLSKVTDEQFKDLAEVKKDVQVAALTETTALREKKTETNGHSGNREAKTEARALTKELAAKFRQENKAAKPLSKQAQKAAKKAAKLPPVKKAAPERHPPSKALLQELLDLSKKRAVISDYMKGLMHAVQYALGEITPEQFGKPWRVFMMRIEGTSFTPPPKKEAPKKKSARPAKKKSKKR